MRINALPDDLPLTLGAKVSPAPTQAELNTALGRLHRDVFESIDWGFWSGVREQDCRQVPPISTAEVTFDFVLF